MRHFEMHVAPKQDEFMYKSLYINVYIGSFIIHI